MLSAYLDEQLIKGMCLFHSKYSRRLCCNWKSDVRPENKITYFFQNRRPVNKIIFAHPPSNPAPVAILCAAALGLFLRVPVPVSVSETELFLFIF